MVDRKGGASFAVLHRNVRSFGHFSLFRYIIINLNAINVKNVSILYILKYVHLMYWVIDYQGIQYKLLQFAIHF